MKEKNTGMPINQDEIYHYLKDIRRIKVMSPVREKELAVKMKSDELKNCFSAKLLRNVSPTIR